MLSPALRLLQACSSGLGACLRFTHPCKSSVQELLSCLASWICSPCLLYCRHKAVAVARGGPVTPQSRSSQRQRARGWGRTSETQTCSWLCNRVTLSLGWVSRRGKKKSHLLCIHPSPLFPRRPQPTLPPWSAGLCPGKGSTPAARCKHAPESWNHSAGGYL